jgi:hypothetical protein
MLFLPEITSDCEQCQKILSLKGVSNVKLFKKLINLHFYFFLTETEIDFFAVDCVKKLNPTRNALRLLKKFEALFKPQDFCIFSFYH